MKKLGRLYRSDFFDEPVDRWKPSIGNSMDAQAEGCHMAACSIIFYRSSLCTNDVFAGIIFFVYFSSKIPFFCCHVVDCFWIWKHAKLSAKYGGILYC
ncbi:hypothetical protein D3C81_1804670 [compost metagenome]